MKLRIISFNIHKGFGRWSNPVGTLASIREAIRHSQADLVFLQEVGAVAREVQFEFLADSVWPHFAYGKNASYPKGHHGNALLSKFPIVTSENNDLSNNRYERRGLLHTVVDWKSENTKLHALCVHLDLLRSGRRKQVQKVLQRIERAVPKQEPLILAGDFNDWGGMVSPMLREAAGLEEVFLIAHGAHAKTFPSWYPSLALDRIYVRGLSWDHATVLDQEPWDDLSDHLALGVDIWLGSKGESDV